MPELPLYSTLVQVDPEKTYDVNYSVINSHVLKNVKVYPFQNNKEAKDPSKIDHLDQEYFKHLVTPSRLR